MKKYNQFSFLGVPLSSKIRPDSQYILNIGLIGKKQAVLHLSQLRNLDSRRLIKKLGYLSESVMNSIKQKINHLNG